MTVREPVVFVVDDDPSVGKGLRRLLRAAGLRVATFASAEEFLQHERLDAPACLVLDLRMPGLDGIELQDRLGANGISIPIVFISGHGDIPTTVQAMKAGAVDFIPKPFQDQTLLDAVRQAIDRDVQARRQRSAVAEIQGRFDSLTSREREVFALVVTGMLNKQIAHQLGVTEKTIKVHRARVMHKMGAESLADLVRLEVQLGLNPSGD